MTAFKLSMISIIYLHIIVAIPHFRMARHSLLTMWNLNCAMLPFLAAFLIIHIWVCVPMKVGVQVQRVKFQILMFGIELFLRRK
jgi:hypothetical protein